MKNNHLIEFKVGDKVKVKITSIVAYGAFCELLEGGSGLIHISEIADNYISDISLYLPLNSIHEVTITALGNKPYTYALSLKGGDSSSRRPRQNIQKAKKPLGRKESNKEELDAYPFTNIGSLLDEMIDKEYTRFKSN